MTSADELPSANSEPGGLPPPSSEQTYATPSQLIQRVLDTTANDEKQGMFPMYAKHIYSPFHPYPTTMAQQHCATYPKMAITFHCSHFPNLFMNRIHHPYPLNGNLHTNAILLLPHAVFSYLRCGLFAHC
jgi:hypothetical protein